jgi:hypothetical protein
MNEIDHFRNFIFYSDDVIVDIDHLHIKRIYLVCFSYVVIKDVIRQSVIHHI